MKNKKNLKNAENQKWSQFDGTTFGVVHLSTIIATVFKISQTRVFNIAGHEQQTLVLIDKKLPETVEFFKANFVPISILHNYPNFESKK